MKSAPRKWGTVHRIDSKDTSKKALSGLLLGVLVSALVFGVGCGGGGGGGGGTTPTGPMAATRFTSAGTGSNAIVMADGNSGSPTVFRLSVRAAGVTDLYGVAFDVEYPSGILSFNGSATEGTFLAGGPATTFNVSEGSAGSIIVAVSRLGGGRGVDGSGDLVTLDFSVLASGDGEFRFTNRGAFGPNGVGKPNVDWIGGSITTVR